MPCDILYLMGASSTLHSEDVKSLATPTSPQRETNVPVATLTIIVLIENKAYKVFDNSVMISPVFD